MSLFSQPPQDRPAPEEALAVGRLPDAPRPMPAQSVEPRPVPRSVARMRARLRARLRVLIGNQRGSAGV